MGAWGYGTFENDGALDHFWVVTEKIAECFTEKKPYTYSTTNFGSIEEMRVAAQLLVSIHRLLSIDDTFLSKAYKAVKAISEDEEWISSWDDEKTIRKEIASELAQIEGCMR